MTEEGIPLIFAHAPNPTRTRSRLKIRNLNGQFSRIPTVKSALEKSQADRSSVYFRFHVATSIAVADSMDYDKKRKAA